MLCNSSAIIIILYNQDVIKSELYITMQVSLLEAAANLNKLVEAAINGEEVILLNAIERPAIKLTPIELPKPNRQPGSAKGLIWMSDDFDEPLAEFLGIKDISDLEL
jgi:antitoxin (DNA-binding transcriptional repressor) of toxin-antitoxin stability system